MATDIIQTLERQRDRAFAEIERLADEEDELLREGNEDEAYLLQAELHCWERQYNALTAELRAGARAKSSSSCSVNEFIDEI